MRSTRSQSQVCTASPISSFCSVFTLHLGFAFVSHHICFKRSLGQVITLVAEWIYTYGVHHWSNFRSSCRKLAYMRFDPTTTDIRSDAPTDLPNGPWVQLAFRTKFVLLLQFHLFVQCSHFISFFALVSRHICFKRSLAEVITLGAEWIDRYGIYYWFLEKAIESCPELDFNQRPLNSAQML